MNAPLKGRKSLTGSQPRSATRYDDNLFGADTVELILALSEGPIQGLKDGASSFYVGDVPLLDKIYESYSFRVIPPMGRMVTGEAEPYQYLVESIRKFPKPQAFAGMIEDAGFRRAKYTPMTGGVVALHSGWKL